MLRHDNACARLAGVMPVAERHFQRHFHTGRAAVGEEDVVETTRRKFQKQRGNLLGRFVSVAGKDDLVKLFGLILNGADDLWMAMTVRHDPPGGDRIDDATTIGGVEICAFPAHNPCHLVLKRLLRKRMPDRRLRPGYHGLKSSRLNEASNAACNVFAVRGESRGNRPSLRTRPISQIALSLSEFPSPMNAIPRISILRLRSASTDNSE